MDVLQFKPSLLKYELPQLVIEKLHEKHIETSEADPEICPLAMEYSQFANVVEKEKTKRIRETLDGIFPPRKLEHEGCLWIQHVTSDPATSVDIINLQEQLAEKCLKQKAQETGICAIRREIYDEFFDEVIRQLTISCPERGLLLSKIRDEIQMTLAAYETLFASSLAYGLRKVLQMKKNELDTAEMEKRIKDEKANLNTEIPKLTKTYERLEKDIKKKQTIYGNQHEEEIQTVKCLNCQLKDQIKKLIFNTSYF